MGCVSEENFRRFHDCFRKGGMRMHAFGKVAHGRAHLHGKHAFGNQFTRAVTGNPYSENALRFRICRLELKLILEIPRKLK